MVAEAHCVVVNRVHIGEIGQALIDIEVKRSLEGVTGVEEHDIRLSRPNALDDRGLSRISAVGLLLNRCSLDMRMHVVAVKERDGNRLIGQRRRADGKDSGNRDALQGKHGPYFAGWLMDSS